VVILDAEDFLGWPGLRHLNRQGSPFDAGAPRNTIFCSPEGQKMS
jgi:hypothetical protein